VHCSRRSTRGVVSDTQASPGVATSVAEASPVYFQLKNASATPAHVYETIDESSLGNAQQHPPSMTSSNVSDFYEREGQGQGQGQQNTESNDCECTLVENDLYR